MMMNYSSAVLLLSAAFAPSQFFTFVGAVNKIRGGSIDTFSDSDGNGDGELLPRVLGRKPPPTPRPPTLPATSPPTIPSTAPVCGEKLTELMTDFASYFRSLLTYLYILLLHFSHSIAANRPTNSVSNWFANMP